MRTSPMADLITEGARLAQGYTAVDGHAPSLARELAHIVVQLRASHHDRNGRPDLAGRTTAYREAVAQLYASTGLAREAQAKLRASVGYYVSDAVREWIREHGMDTPETWEYYKLHPHSRRARLVMSNARRRRADPLASIAEAREHLAGMDTGVLAPGDAERVRGALERLAEATEALRNSL